MKEELRTKKRGKLKEVSRNETVAFEINPYYEQLLEMREKKPEAYRLMSMATLLAVKAYVKAKEAAAEQKSIKAAA